IMGTRSTLSPVAMPGRPQSLGSLIGTVIDKLGLSRRMEEAQMVEAWTEVAGPQISRITTSSWVKGDTLYVKVQSAAWRQELHLQRSAWKDRLNRHLGRELVHEIRFC